MRRTKARLDAGFHRHDGKENVDYDRCLYRLIDCTILRILNVASSEGARRIPGHQVGRSIIISRIPRLVGLHPSYDFWLIEHDYLELKSEIGHNHFEGRGWRGFRHHASL
ncbi:MAG: hypothetical protein MN733_26425 [Nitrososphaera sp.]|nr:hypothetical protein [Nitrososphaera sp.]